MTLPKLRGEIPTRTDRDNAWNDAVSLLASQQPRAVPARGYAGPTMAERERGRL